MTYVCGYCGSELHVDGEIVHAADCSALRHVEDEDALMPEAEAFMMNTDDGPKLCTTSGESVDVVRANQTEQTGQHKGYIVLCPDERAKGFVRPYRDAYKHVGRFVEKERRLVDWREREGGCGSVTTMGRALSETYARDPTFYGLTFCCHCNRHLPVGEFMWTADGQTVGS